MERIAIQDLIKWKNSPRRKPLMVWGARQVGKTYLIKDIFAERYYPDHFIYVDCKTEDSVRRFCDETADAARILEYISLLKGKEINAETLLIFDEIQECPNLVSALKYFCQDFPHIPVIATGSMVRIKIQRIAKKRGTKSGEFLFPVGKINQLTLYPMTFDEFLFNRNKVLFSALKSAYQESRPLEPAIHEMAMDRVYRYLMVGGMPEAVDAYLQNENYLEVREILTDLYDNYLDDMELYQASRESVLRSRQVFRHIYTELNRESRNFSPGLLEKNSKTRDFGNPIEWLTMAHVVHQSWQTKEHVTLPLMEENASSFRLFLGDPGMFAYQSGINAASFLSADRENTLSGIFFENFVADELTAKGNRLFYWKGKSSEELEFLAESAGKLYPIDVKKGKGILNSLEKFSSHNHFEYAVKISRNNFGFSREKKTLTIPFYFLSFLAADLAAGTMKSIDELSR